MKGFVYKTLYDEGIFIADSIISAINAATCIGSAVLIGEAAYETNNYEINNTIFSFSNAQRKWEYLVQSNDDDINNDYTLTKFSAFSDDDYAEKMLKECCI